MNELAQIAEWDEQKKESVNLKILNCKLPSLDNCKVIDWKIKQNNKK